MGFMNRFRQATSQHFAATGVEAEAARLLNQGMQQYQASQFKAALQSWEKALSLYRKIRNRRGEAQSLNNLGNAYDTLGQYQKAFDYHQQQRVITQELDDHLGQAKSYSGMGTACYSLGQYQQAIDYHQQSLAAAQELGDRLGAAISLGNLGNAHETLGQYQQAIDYHQQSLSVFEELGDYQGKASSLGNLGIAHYALGQYQEAINYHQQALGLFEQLGDRWRQANSLNNLGNTYYALGQYQETIDYYQRSLAASQSLEDCQGEANSFNSLGNAYYSLGQYQKAIDHHQRSLTIAQAIGDRRGEAIALSNLGNDYDALGQYPKVLEYHQRSLAIAKEIGERRLEATALNNLGSAYNSLGQYRKAIGYYQQSLTIEREIGNRRGEIQSLNSLGNAYDTLEQYQEAIDCHNQQLTIAREIGYPQGEASALGGLGNAYDTLGQFQKAIDYHQQSLTVKRKLGDRQGEATSLGNLGRVYHFLGQYQKAIDYQQQSLAVAQAIGDRKGEGTSLNNLGAALFHAGQLVEAERHLHQGMQVWESLRVGLEDADKVSVFDEQTRIYRLLQLVLVAQNRTQDALEIAERGRARAFAELLAQRLSPQAADLVTITPPNFQQIQQIAQAQNATLVEYSIIYDYFDLEDRKQVRESMLLIWAIEPNGDIAFCSVDLKPLWEQQNIFLGNLILNAYEALSSAEQQYNGSETTSLEPPPTRRISVWSQQLYQLLIQPITDLLPARADRPVIFIPQDSLFLVSFPALQDPKGNFLIEQHAIRIAPSIQALELTSQQRQYLRHQKQEAKDQVCSALVVGNPTMPTLPLSEPPQSLDPLPRAAAEVQAIAALLKTSAITGDQATKVNIIKQLPQARLIHIATHGIWDDVRLLGVPEAIAERAPGAIALAPSGGDNGFLAAGEILNLKLQAELVVLSACVTGLGKLSADGVIGLSRSLIAAGVSSVVVSLWSVNDQSTAFLMVKFYQNLQQGTSPAVALNQAQRWLLNVTKKKLQAWVKANQIFLSATLEMQLRRQLRKMPDNAQPFQEPFHWAAFCAIGQ